MGMMKDNVERKSVVFIELLTKLLDEGKKVEIELTTAEQLEVQISDDKYCGIGISKDMCLHEVESLAFALVDATEDSLIKNE